MTEVVRANWFEQYPRRAKWLVFLVCLLFFELLIRALVGVGLVSHQVYPTNREPVFWAYIDPVVGIWRYPDTTFRHVTDCVDQAYTTNSVGARDRERSWRSDAERRVVVLGDSMVEGYGVGRGERLTDRLEAMTGIEHLNFGSGGKFGTIQEWLYYREYASRYDHSDVFVFIFPANDFDDNSAENFDEDIYRPFLRQSASGFEVYYPVDFEQRNTSSRSTFDIVRNHVDNNVYILNAVNVGLNVLKRSLRKDRPDASSSNYDDFSAEELAILLYALDAIINIADERAVTLVTIPEGADYAYAKQNGYGFRLVDELARFAAAHQNVRYLDLLPGMLDYSRANEIEYAAFTLGCNRHWGGLGSQVAAQLVHEFVFGDR